MKANICPDKERMELLRRGIIILPIILLVAALLTALSCQRQPAPTPRPAPAPVSTPRQAFQPLPPTIITPEEKVGVDQITKAMLLDFTQAQRSLDQNWESFRKSYMDWRQRAAQSEGLVYKNLNDFLASFVAVKRDIYQLQAPRGAGDVVERLVQAAEREDAALKELRDNWKGDEAPFQKYEKERQEVNKLRRQATSKLQELMAPSPARARTPDTEEPATPPATARRTRTVDPQALQQLERSLQAVNRKWNDFHASYDGWRSRDYSSEREAGYSQLSAFASDFRGLLSKISSLPAPAPLRPVAELLVQAAEKEEGALRDLKDNWKPFDSRYYQAYEREWENIDRLRRQARASLTDLLLKYGISPLEVK